MKTINTYINAFYDLPQVAKDEYAKINAKVISSRIKCDIEDKYKQHNAKLNELTGMKTIRDNMPDSDYISFQHYRLLFKEMPDQLIADAYVANPIPLILQHPNVNNGKPFRCTIEDAYKICHIEEVWHILEKYLFENNLVDVEFWNTWKKATFLIAPCHMMILKSDLFKEYVDFAWPICLAMADKIDYSKITDAYQMRQVAFIAERLFSYFICYKATKCNANVIALDTVKHHDWKPFSDQDERKIDKNEFERTYR